MYPVPQCAADDLAAGGVLAGGNGVAGKGHHFRRQGNTDFLGSGHSGRCSSLGDTFAVDFGMAGRFRVATVDMAF